MHRIIKFSQETWLKSYINMKPERKYAKNDLKKGFFKQMNNIVLGKTMEKVRKHRDIKLITIESRGVYLVLESKYHTTKFYSNIY